MKVGQLMTEGVVTAAHDATLAEVGALMQRRHVGSVVIVEHGRPVGILTDRDLAMLVVAGGADRDELAGDCASAPLVSGESAMELEEAAALMVQHGVRRLPVVDDGRLAGIVTLDDVAVRTGDLKLARQLTAEVARAALPEFFFHQRGG